MSMYSSIGESVNKLSIHPSCVKPGVWDFIEPLLNNFLGNNGGQIVKLSARFQLKYFQDI